MNFFFSSSFLVSCFSSPFQKGVSHLLQFCVLLRICQLPFLYIWQHILLPYSSLCLFSSLSCNFHCSVSKMQLHHFLYPFDVHNYIKCFLFGYTISVTRHLCAVCSTFYAFNVSLPDYCTCILQTLQPLAIQGRTENLLYIESKNSINFNLNLIVLNIRLFL